MYKEINNCLQAAQLLLCLFVFGFMGCSSLKDKKRNCFESSKSLLHVVINEDDIPIFSQRMKELNINSTHVSYVVKNVEYNEGKDFCFSFQFLSPTDFLALRSEILATGLVKKIYNNSNKF